MRIAIYGQYINKKNIKYIINFINYFNNKLVEFFFEKNFLNILNKFNIFKNIKFYTFFSYKDLSKKKFNFMIVFGGDGTILSSVTLIRDLKIPIMGVNTGKLGFLANFNKKTFLKKIDLIINEKLKPIPRNLLTLEICNNNFSLPKNFISLALNEIVISRRETVSIMNIDTYINNIFLTSYWADGLIISTSTGSTGYSLSCGGPIITPDSNNFVITPIAPHNLFSRPLVIPDNKIIKLRVHNRIGTYSLSMDTRLSIMDINNELIIRKNNFYIYIFQEKEDSYFNSLQEKLFWGVDKRNNY